MAKRGPTHGRARKSRSRGADVYEDPAQPGRVRHAACWKLRGVDPKGFLKRSHHEAPFCASCQQALSGHLQAQEMAKRAAEDRQLAAALERLAAVSFEMMKSALVESWGRQVLEPNELKCIYPDLFTEFQRAWLDVQEIIYADRKLIGEHRHRWLRPQDHIFKNLPDFFQVPWFDASEPAHILCFANPAALMYRAARAAREQAEWRDQRCKELFGETGQQARVLGIQQHDAAPRRVAEVWIYQQLHYDDRALMVILKHWLRRYDLTDEEIAQCRVSDDFLAHCILHEGTLRRYQEDKGILARSMLTPEEHAQYMREQPAEGRLGQIFEQKLRRFREREPHWEAMIEGEENRLKVGKSRSAKVPNEVLELQRPR